MSSTFPGLVDFVFTAHSTDKVMCRWDVFIVKMKDQAHRHSYYKRILEHYEIISMNSYLVRKLV